MRKAALVGTFTTALILVFGLMIAPIVGASGGYGPAAQDTPTATPEDGTPGAETVTPGAETTPGVDLTPAAETVTPGAATTPGADVTVVATTATATVEAAATGTAVAPGNLPDTGAGSGPSLLLILVGAAALLILGLATVATVRTTRGDA